jgi:uncharacterized protein (DUF433 family)
MGIIGRQILMGMFDTIYAELVCPFCGWQYRHTPLSWEQAKRECEERKEGELKYAQPPDNPWDQLIRHTQALQARADGYTVEEGKHEQEDILAWNEQLDSPKNIERWRTCKELGLAEIQTEAFDSILGIYPVHWGHYFIEEGFPYQGCREKNAREYVKAWIEINPQVMLGKPVIRGTRIMVELILRKLSEGATETDLLEAYPKLSRQDIRAALAYAARTVSHEEIMVQIN